MKISSFGVSEENVRLIGRYVIKDGTLWLVQSGSAAEFTVIGKTAELIIKGDSSIHSPFYHRPRFAVYVNEKLIIDKTTDKPEEVIGLFAGENTVTVKVKVMMLSEAEYGAVGIGCINIDTDENAPIRPTPKKDMSIEFIGDSITCAYGVEGAGCSDPFRTSTENFTRSYAYLTSQKLKADYSAVCYSGHGIISGYNTSGVKDTQRLVPDFYGKASKLPDYSEKWDFDKHKNDIVVVNLGTNDSSYITADGRMHFDERINEFMEGYIAFLKTVREKNRDAYIICTFGTMDNDDIHGHVGKAADRYIKETHDSRVIFVHTELQRESDGYGCDWHPSEITHRKLADMLADKISSILAAV